jgi:hypothetical protein
MTRMIYTPNRMTNQMMRMTPMNGRKRARYALWVVFLAALPLAACLGVTVLLNICGG